MMITLNSWYFTLTEGMRIAVITSIIAVISIIATAAVALIVAKTQASMSQRSLDAQKRSIFLSLIDRRAKWLDDTVHLWSQALDENREYVEALLQNAPPPHSDTMAKVVACRQEARWLFGPEVIDHLDALEAGVNMLADAQLRMRGLGYMTAEEKSHEIIQSMYEAFTDASATHRFNVDKLINMLRPYLYVGDIKAPMSFDDLMPGVDGLR